MPHTTYHLPLPNGTTLTLGAKPTMMGILNVTPDSFSDGGDFASVNASLAHAREMIAEGADIIDVGGESTRPGAVAVSMQQELDRVVPVIEAITAAKLANPVSIDTYKALVADQAIQSGASIINDVHGLQRDPEIADVAALYDVPLIIMHWDADRDTSKPIIDEMGRYFDRSLAIAEKAGVKRERIVLDPGFGFAKSLADNYALMRDLGRLATYHMPILVGTSRKSMIGKLLGNEPKERLAGTIATNVMGYHAGGHIFRVHDVLANRDALRVAQAILYGPPDSET
jgi:dihydropteroate synthase